jgi:splicing factor 3B subunit 3
LEQYGPATDVKVADLKGDGNPQIYLLNASGSGRSYLRVIKQGLKVKELSSIKYQKGYDIWSLKSSLNDEYDSLIIISFAAKTAVLKLTESGYSQTSGTGIEADTKTLHVGRLRDNSLIQITPNGFRHIRKGDNKNIKIDKGGNVLKGITNNSQIALALTGGDIVYYELTNSGDFEQHETSLDDEVVSMDFAPIEKNRVRSQFLAVALRDMTVRIF